MIIVLTSFFQINNPDMRVVIMKNYVKEHFPQTELLDYALEVEKITTSKVCLCSFYRLGFIHVVIYGIDESRLWKRNDWVLNWTITRLNWKLQLLENKKRVRLLVLLINDQIRRKNQSYQISRFLLRTRLLINNTTRVNSLHNTVRCLRRSCSIIYVRGCRIAVHILCLFCFQKPNLILNVDGCIAVGFIDLLRNCGCFTR